MLDQSSCRPSVLAAYDLRSGCRSHQACSLWATVSWIARLRRSMVTFTNAASLDLQLFSMHVPQSGPVLVHLRLEIMDGILSGCPSLVDIKSDRAVRRRLWQKR